MQELISTLQSIVSVPLLMGNDISEKYHHDWSAEAAGIPIAVARPATTTELAAIMAACHKLDQPVVVQGGLSGLCGGGNPRNNELAISLERMNNVEEIDHAAMTMTVQAGTPLQIIQEAADAAGFMFPVDLGARGTCQIGGNISTNAGGNQVLRYGMTRNMVLGLEAVLADGTVISSMNKMLKNNAGYDLKQLFIGTEGTLGIVARAVLRLFPKARSRCTAMLALSDFDSVVTLMQRMTSEFSGSLSTFEVMWSSYYHCITDEIGSAQTPFDTRYPIYVLTEIEGANQSQDQERFEEVLGATLEEGLVQDAVLASSERERENLWLIRDGVAELGNFIKDSGNFDVSVPISAMETFLNTVEAGLKAMFPEIKILVFGHVADSNLHFICSTGKPADVKSIYKVVYQAVGQFGGSVSAEHGIGVQKLDFLHHSRSDAEIALMRTLKCALDPKNLLNPGRVIKPV